MFRLLLIRHAKSSWKQPLLEDHQRPLNKRGRKDVARMARWLKQQGESPQAIYSSTALRAWVLAQAMATQLDRDVYGETSLYTFSARQLLAAIQALPDNENHLAVVGHNPAITELLNQLCSENVSNVPTSAIAALDCDIHAWSQLAAGCCQLDYLACPKDLPGSVGGAG